MRPVLFLAAAMALVASPVLSQAPAPPPSSNTSGPAEPYPYDRMPGPDRQCFNGKVVVGANRAGEKVVFVEGKRGGVFRLELADSCGALKAAEKPSVRANGTDLVCAGDPATMLVKTAAGPKRCEVDKVRRLTKTELATLATAGQR